MRGRVPQFEAREQVVDRLRESDLVWTIVRPSGFFNDLTEILEMAAKGTVWLIGDGNAPLNPIHGADLAEFIVERLVDPSAAWREFPVGGPDLLSQTEIAELAFAALGTEARIHPSPRWLMPAIAKCVMPFNGNLGSFLAMLGALGTSQNVSAPQRGSRRLGDFFERCVESGSIELRVKH